MAVVIASNLAKDVAGHPLLRGVSFKLERRERMALSGPNGVGKTTLLRMLAAEESLDGGELVFGKDVRVALADQRPIVDGSKTLRDYVLDGAGDLVAIETELSRLEQAMAAGADDRATLGRYAQAQARLEHAGGYDWRARALSNIRGLGFDPESDLDRPLRTFSGGELTRAALARSLAGDPDLLLLDEPTNHLDIEALEWLEGMLTGLDAAIVLVAHDRWFLEAVATSVLELDSGRGRYFPGRWHAWRKEKAMRELAQARAGARQQAEIERLERFVTRFRAGTRSRQAKSRARKLERVSSASERGVSIARSRKAMKLDFGPATRSGRVVFEFLDGRIVVGERVLLDGAELWLERGEHVSLVGRNGAGKSTLIELLSGRRALDSSSGGPGTDRNGGPVSEGNGGPVSGGTKGPLINGKLRTGHNVKIGFLSQHDDFDAGTARTVLEATQRATGLTPGKARALLGRFLFSGEDADKPLEVLSGGERRRVALAILVGTGANVLVLDEPTNHLDLESREALEEALRGFEGAVLIVSHDRALLDAVGTRTIAFEETRLRSYSGGWAEYVRARREPRGVGAEG